MMKAKNKITRISILFTIAVIIFSSCDSKGLKVVELKDGMALLDIKKQFVCSMHPQVVRDQPGDCPICEMFLIEKIDNDKNPADSSLNTVVGQVNGSVLASAATVIPSEENLPLIIAASGIINYDERKMHTFSARFRGLVEKSYVKYQFQPIRKGQKIYDIYCPDIYLERWNYVLLIQTYPDNDKLTAEALEWFRLIGHTKEQIEALKRMPKPNYHLSVYSDVEGFAVSADFDPAKYSSSENEEAPGRLQTANPGIGLNEGTSIETGTPLFKVIDINSLRADLKVRTEDVWQLRRGQKVILTDAFSPERGFNAIVSQIEPLNNGLFQLVKVYFTDKNRLLLPGRQIQAHIQAGSHKALWVPKSAIANLGQTSSVFLLTDGRFIATTVRTGINSGDKVEIISGIGKNSKIALNALLLTDSDGFITSNAKQE